MEGCAFCNDLHRGESAQESIANRILHETENFLVFPSLGQIVEGYLLIASKAHYISIGAMPSGLYDEFDGMKEKVKKVLTENYSVPLFFEHGAASKYKRAGCCIEHMHLHAVPVQMNITDFLAEHFEHIRINSYESLKEAYKKEISYLYVEDNDGERHLFPVREAVPSQYIRKVIASRLGMPERWDWRVYQGMEEIKNTLKKLNGKF